jgi:hypothetical protein
LGISLKLNDSDLGGGDSDHETRFSIHRSFEGQNSGKKRYEKYVCACVLNVPRKKMLSIETCRKEKPTFFSLFSEFCPELRLIYPIPDFTSLSVVRTAALARFGT